MRLTLKILRIPRIVFGQAGRWRTHSCVPHRDFSRRRAVGSQPPGIDTSVDAARRVRAPHWFWTFSRDRTLAASAATQCRQHSGLGPHIVAFEQRGSHVRTCFDEEPYRIEISLRGRSR